MKVKKKHDAMGVGAVSRSAEDERNAMARVPCYMPTLLTSTTSTSLGRERPLSTRLDDWHGQL